MPLGGVPLGSTPLAQMGAPFRGTCFRLALEYTLAVHHDKFETPTTCCGITLRDTTPADRWHRPKPLLVAYNNSSAAQAVDGKEQSI